jgi:hypothetical protein
MNEDIKKHIIYCCYINPDGTSCGKNHDLFEIWNTTPGADPYDYTHSCEDHIPYMLGSLNKVTATQWEMHFMTETSDLKIDTWEDVYGRKS